MAQDEFERLFKPKLRRVIALVHDGYTNEQIAAEMGTTKYAVMNLLRELFDRLGLWNRVELALWYEANVLHP